MRDTLLPPKRPSRSEAQLSIAEKRRLSNILPRYKPLLHQDVFKTILNSLSGAPRGYGCWGWGFGMVGDGGFLLRNICQPQGPDLNRERQISTGTPIFAKTERKEPFADIAERTILVAVLLADRGCSSRQNFDTGDRFGYPSYLPSNLFSLQLSLPANYHLFYLPLLSHPSPTLTFQYT